MLPGAIVGDIAGSVNEFGNKLVSKYRTAKRLQDAEIANEQYIKREVTHYYDHDGCLVIKARLPAEQGALIVKALEMAMDTAFVGARPAREKVVPAGTSDEREPISARRADPHRAWDALVRGRPAAECHLEDGPGVYPKGTWPAGERMDWHAAVGSLFY